MKQLDWVGDVKEKPFKDIRNQRDAIAEEKARLCLLIKERCNKAPKSIMSGGSINEVSNWKRDREAALKVCSNKRSSAGDLEAALNSMARWK